MRDNRDNNGVPKFLENLNYDERNAIQIFPKLDGYLDNDEKLMIDRIEMGSSSGMRIRTNDNRTGKNTKEFVEGKIKTWIVRYYNRKYRLYIQKSTR